MVVAMAVMIRSWSQNSVAPELATMVNGLFGMAILLYMTTIFRTVNASTVENKKYYFAGGRYVSEKEAG